MKLARALLLPLFFFATPAEPCDCVPVRSVADELRAADAVFVGTFTTEMLTAPQLELGDIGKQQLIFEVEAGFKNVRTETVVLMNRLHSTCALEFVKGDTYLIYAFKTTKGELHTHNCSRSGHIDRVLRDFEELPEPEYVKED